MEISAKAQPSGYSVPWLDFLVMGRAAPWQPKRWQSSSISTQKALRFTNDILFNYSLARQNRNYHPHFPVFKKRKLTARNRNWFAQGHTAIRARAGSRTQAFGTQGQFFFHRISLWFSPFSESWSRKDDRSSTRVL